MQIRLKDLNAQEKELHTSLICNTKQYDFKL